MSISMFILLIFFNSLSIITGSSSNIILPNNVPNVWGGNSSAPPGGVLGGCSGWLFGFSGLDGATSELHRFPPPPQLRKKKNKQTNTTIFFATL